MDPKIINEHLKDWINSQPNLRIQGRMAEVGYEIPAERRPMRRVMGKFFSGLESSAKRNINTRTDTKAAFPGRDECLLEIWDVSPARKPRIMCHFGISGWHLRVAALKEFLNDPTFDEATFLDVIRP